ncbi:MAG TPA: PAC2 family protein [Actinobacteria bacterium]|nr:PAC2 family protein [Actinomycetota bacterium]
MSSIEWLEEPHLLDPVAIVGFEGWNDASDAASGVAEYLIDQAEVQPFARLDMEQYVNYQMSRPHVLIAETGRVIHWPSTGFFRLTLQDSGRHLVVVLGDEPHLRWQGFTSEIVDMLSGLGVTTVVTLGAFIGQVPHTLPVPIFGDAAEPGLTDRLGVIQSNYEGPTGIVGVLHSALRDAGFSATTLWAAVPHYLAANPNPKATLTLLEHLGRAIGHNFDVENLITEVEDFEHHVAEAMDGSSDFIEYVRQLESSADKPMVEAREGEQLVQEIENYLKDSD